MVGDRHYLAYDYQSSARMNILLFTPTSISSAIGRVSSLLVMELLASGHEVKIICSEKINELSSVTHPFPCEVILWNEFDRVRAHIQVADLLAYQIGDSYQFHAGCLVWLQEAPGLVFAHDFYLGSLFWSWAHTAVELSEARAKLCSLYGTSVAAKFFDHASGDAFIEYASNHAPMTEWIGSMASGIICHSEWGLSRLKRSCLGPVKVAPLPYNALTYEHTGDKSPTKQVVFLTIGHVNSNKRYTSIIKAIGASNDLKTRISFRIVGAAEKNTVNALKQLACELSVNVVFTGKVDDAMLASEIYLADVMCCLRFPALESASASTIESMLNGKAIVVCNTGFYKDLPNDCVVKVSIENEHEDLIDAFERLSSSESLRSTLGKRAKIYAQETFRIDSYVRTLEGIKYQIDIVKQRIAVVKKFHTHLNRWGWQGDVDLIKHTASALSILGEVSSDDEEI